MSCEIKFENHQLTITVEGMFSFDTWLQFKELEIDEQDIRECLVDFSRTAVIDSHGIGGLLVLKEKIGDDVEIKLINTSAGINKIIASVNFDDMFTLV